MFTENIPFYMLGPPKFCSRKSLCEFATLGWRFVSKGHFFAFGRLYSLAQFQLITGEHSRGKPSRYGIRIDNENM